MPLVVMVAGFQGGMDLQLLTGPGLPVPEEHLLLRVDSGILGGIHL